MANQLACAINFTLGSGLHIMMDFGVCSHRFLLSDAYTAQTDIEKIIKASGLTIVKSHFHSFDKWYKLKRFLNHYIFNRIKYEYRYGYTGFIILAESHFSIHCWPELGKLNACIYTCNYENDNTAKTKFVAEEVKKMFQPLKFKFTEIDRG